MAGVFDFLHIKRRTAGSSNELSLDVLDAARDELDAAKRQRGSRLSSGPRSSQGSYHGVAGTSTLSAVPEVERRKKARRARSMRLWTVGIMVALLLVGTGAYFGYRFYQEKVDFNGRLDSLIGRFVEVDRFLVSVDSLINEPLSSLKAKEREDAIEAIPATESELASIIVEADSMKESARIDADIVVLGEVDAAANARQEMLSAAGSVFELSRQVKEKTDEANRVWDEVIAADQLAREATNAANIADTEEATIAAREKTSSALDQMNEALEELKKIEGKNKGIDLSAQRNYLETKTRALGHAIATSDALLENNREEASQENESYNTDEREAAKLASSLPPVLGDQVEELYRDALDERVEAYQSARSHVSAADADLRS